ncbi:MAG: hypothetical protein SFY66_22565 [Oculatellaceae cyanobacterium bins.114]|nr:hypothetical protein [Oculatellaceae cyanobacterium bins.114]
MLKGVYLTLMVGPTVPTPVPQVVLDALTDVTVTIASGKTSGFQLTFTLSNRSPLQTIFLLSGGSPIPVLRVILVVTANGTPEVLMDGVVTNHEIKPGKDAQHSILTITGEDLTRVMDYLNASGIPYPATPAEGRVALILAKYAVLGIVPQIVPSVFLDVPIPSDRIPTHRSTDLKYIQYLANKVGYVFYLIPGPKPGESTAYWGPEIKVGTPQPALNIDMDIHTNVDSLSFNFDNSKRELPVINILEKTTKFPISIPVPSITPLNPPLGLIPPIPKTLKPIRGLAKYSPVQAIAVGLAKAAQSAEAVSAFGSLDVTRYGQILKARQLVGVRGAGLAFDGLYYVKSVTHRIKRGEYKQDFTLSRNGLVSTLPKIPV